MSTLIHAQSKAPVSKNDSSSLVSGLVQRKCACGNAAGLTGSCPACESERRFGKQPIQAKLKISEPNDPYEQEADRVADEVMRMPVSPGHTINELANHSKIDEMPSNPGGQYLDTYELRPGWMELSCEASASSSARAHTTNRAQGNSPARVDWQDSSAVFSDSNLSASADISAVHNAIQPGGRPLDANTRNFMEQRFGWDFSQVNIHTGKRAAELAQAMNARAYTIGNEVIFGADQFSPQTLTGRRLLAHELTHVIQQGRGQRSVQRAPPDQSLVAEEAEKNREVPPRVFKMGKSTRGGNRSLDVDIELSGRARVVPIGSRSGKSLRESWIEAFHEEFLIQLNETTLSGRDPDEILRGLNYLRENSFEVEMLGDRDPELDASYIFESAAVYEEAAKAERLAAIEATLRTQNPEESLRYQTQEIEKSEPKDPKDPTGPRKTVTDFRCNTFATDFVDLIANTAGVFNAYLPKVWWSHPNETKKHSTDLDSAKVFSQSPQALNLWLQKWGNEYGWVEITDPENAGKIAQEKANQGILVIFSLSNHIGLIVAETSTISARRVAGKVTRPVIAQAGVTKIKRGRKKSSLKFETTWLYYYDPSQDKSLVGTVVRR